MNLENQSIDDEFLQDEQEELVAQLLAEQNLITPKRGLEIVPQPRPEKIPLSFAQQRLWFLEQWEPQQSLYNTATQYRIVGHLDQQTLEDSLNEIVRRHEILRTTFRTVDEMQVQSILPELFIPLRYRDLRSIAATDPMTSLQREAMEIIKAPFSLEDGPLLRATLFQIEHEEFVLLISIHHIITDGWSLHIFQQELGAFYSANVHHMTSSLPPLSIQYADFTLWQRERLQGQRLAQQLAYWRQQLAEIPTIVTLPGDHPRPATSSSVSAEYNFEIPPNTVARLKEISTRQNATLFMTMLATFNVLISKLSNQNDIVVGSPIANRTRPELEGLIGFFINTLVLRLQLDRQASFSDVLTQIRLTILEAYEHQDLPFEKLVEDLAPERNSSYTPLFQILFILQNAASTPLSLSDLQVEVLPHADTTTPFDLTVELEETQDLLQTAIKYRTDLFESTTIQHLVECWQTLLLDIIANPEKSIAELTVLPETDCSLLLEKLASSRQDDHRPLCVHELFEEQVETAPTAPALVTDENRISYAELNRKANQVAHTLQHIQTSEQPVIAVVLSNGIFQVTALLAILKAGYTFVCLDPDYPQARLQHSITETQPACFITESRHYVSCLELADTIPIIVVNGKEDQGAEQASRYIGQETIDVQPAINLATKVELDSVAYIAYTSGSTGQPKGIVQRHHTLTQFVQWFGKQFSLHPGKRLAHWATIVYDASYGEIFATLCSGASLCQTNTSTKYDPKESLRWLQAERITHMQTVPGFCKQLLHFLEATEAPLPDLEFVLLAGEVLPIELARRWLERYPERPHLYNLYGPSEILLATYYHVQTIHPRQSTIPIGEAIPGRQLLILDETQHLCPPGFPGEITIRSPYLTPGYLKQPEKTSEVFGVDPLHPHSTDRIYRTSDIGRCLPDGTTFEFLGRRDKQVKIRGIRIELEEIEAVLQKSELVEECAVLIHIHNEEQYIIAYAIARSPYAEQLQTEQIVAGIFRFLKELLPKYMLPAQVIILPQFPRTLSGKLDRQALPEPSLRSLATEKTLLTPHTPIEATLKQIWQEVLHLDEISIDDNFFAIGGHSLLATQIVSRIHNIFQIECPLRTFFTSPTIAELSQFVAQQLHGKKEEAKNAPLLESATEASEAEKLLATLDQLSDDEITALFDSMLTESTDNL
ncbi:MAG TPA: amino acid adenylation domain-containing protein [Ktedonobacteraceae bacterium]|nr:amino acid adenylation domain-containing protein [Ktedonobacteraceae bacterium]